MLIASIALWEKELCVLMGLGLFVVMKVMDYYTELDHKEDEAQ